MGGAGSPFHGFGPPIGNFNLGARKFGEFGAIFRISHPAPWGLAGEKRVSAGWERLDIGNQESGDWEEENYPKALGLKRCNCNPEPVCVTLRLRWYIVYSSPPRWKPKNNRPDCWDRLHPCDALWVAGVIRQDCQVLVEEAQVPMGWEWLDIGIQQGGEGKDGDCQETGSLKRCNCNLEPVCCSASSVVRCQRFAAKLEPKDNPAAYWDLHRFYDALTVQGEKMLHVGRVSVESF
jgi:hypothetical protein